MDSSEKFTHIVGKLPFTGKHAIHAFYREGSRAAQRGNYIDREFYAGRIGHIATANAKMGFLGFMLSATAVGYGTAEQAWQFAPTAVAAAAFGLGHTVAALAERVIKNRLMQQPVNYEASPGLPITPPIVQPSTTWERTVTYGGLAVAMAVPLHFLVYEVVKNY